MRTPDQVSVIIPTYNRAALLNEALRSVMAQTAPPGEVIVVDDGSTDDTAAVVRPFSGAGLPLIYVRLQRTNDLALLRHTGIQRATGSLIALLDSDDMWLPERIERQLSHWNRRPAAGLAFCNVQRFDHRGPFPGGPWLDPSKDYSGRILRQILFEPVVVPSALMFDRLVYERVGPFHSRAIGEDYEWLLKAAALYPAEYLPDALVMFRAHEGSMSREKSLQANIIYLDIVRRFVRTHPELSPDERRAARLGMANVHVKVARNLLEAHRPARAARYARRAIRLNPTDRRPYGLLARSLVARYMPSRPENAEWT